MSETDAQELEVRCFLLGQLDEYECGRIEERVMVNAHVGEGLIEDYLDGMLDPADQKSIRKHFVATGQQPGRSTFLS